MPLIVQVPASTTNLGPGFDCLGAALELWNRIEIEKGNASREYPEVVSSAAARLFTATGISPFGFRFEIAGKVPRARGLGSSATLRLGVLLGLNALAGEPANREQLFHLCTELEGHPDNAAAACYGGFTIVRQGQVSRFDIDPSIRFVLFVPEIEVKTDEARRLLPQAYTREAVVQNLANVSWIAASFVSKDYQKLRNVFADSVHQPYRKPLVPFLDRVIEAGTEAGALGGFLSGSGSTIACLTTERPAEVGAAMLKAAPEIQAEILIVGADNLGARIL
jgi:homoserine kinase